MHGDERWLQTHIQDTRGIYIYIHICAYIYIYIERVSTGWGDGGRVVFRGQPRLKQGRNNEDLKG